jgi:hypothetical protein
MSGGMFQLGRFYPPKTDEEFDSLIPIKEWAIKYHYALSSARQLRLLGKIKGYRYSRRVYIYDRPPDNS